MTRGTARVRSARSTSLLRCRLAGCGEDQDEAYCEALRPTRSSSLRCRVASRPAALLDNLADAQELSEQAPVDLKDEWQTSSVRVEASRRRSRTRA